MAAKEKAGTVKVLAVYDGLVLDRITLWGVDFAHDGEAYFAELDKDTAAAMIEAGRVKAA